MCESSSSSSLLYSIGSGGKVSRRPSDNPSRRYVQVRSYRTHYNNIRCGDREAITIKYYITESFEKKANHEHSVYIYICSFVALTVYNFLPSPFNLKRILCSLRTRVHTDRYTPRTTKLYRARVIYYIIVRIEYTYIPVFRAFSINIKNGCPRCVAPLDFRRQIENGDITVQQYRYTSRSCATGCVSYGCYLHVLYPTRTYPIIYLLSCTLAVVERG